MIRKVNNGNTKDTKGPISEDDISTLLARYTATTLLTLLQEVANYPDTRIDWNALVKKSKTRITNAREYQMLWRHLAYLQPVVEELEEGAEPLDDESDIEANLEVCPGVSNDALTEASAYAKVHIASGLLGDSNLPNNTTVEAPLTLLIPKGQSFRTQSDNSQVFSTHGRYIAVPVIVQKQPLFVPTPVEELDAGASGSVNMISRRKRKPWTNAEDTELIAAVQKFGEGNWANILKGEFKGERTATQLSQRWGIIRKRRGNSIVEASNLSLPQLSEVQLAARNAISAALDGKKRLVSSVNTAATNLDNVEVVTSTTQSQYQTQQATATASRVGLLSSTPKSQIPSVKVPVKRCMSPNSMVKATAVAAGARIATPEDAASLLKAAQANNAVHIMPGAGSMIKSAVSGPATPSLSTHLGAHKNVHFLSSGKAVAPRESRPDSLKPTARTVQSFNATSSPSMDIDLPPKQEVKTANAPMKQVQESNPMNKIQVDEDLTALPEQDEACASSNGTRQPVEDYQATLSDPEGIITNQLAVDKNQVTNIENAGMDFRVEEGDYDQQSEVKES